MSSGDSWISYSNAHHYIIDGVPMKINNSFQPKQFKDNLPNDIRVNASTSKALKFSYEFETEDGYISWYEDYVQECEERRLDRKKREEMAKKEQEIKKSAKVETSLPSVTNKAAPAITTPLIATRPAPTKPTVTKQTRKPEPPPICNTILMPQRASPVTVTAAITSTNASAVNVKDFENLAEDPFESAELNTINDLEVLKSLLSQNMTSSQPIVTSADGPMKDQPTTDAEAVCGSDTTTSTPSSEPTVAQSKERPSTDVYENVFKRRPQNDGDIYENATELRKSIPQPQSFTNVKLPIPAPRACNSEPTSPEVSKSKLLTPELKTDEKPHAAENIVQDTVSSSTQAKKPAVKPKPKFQKVDPSSTTPSSSAVSSSTHSSSTASSSTASSTTASSTTASSTTASSTTASSNVALLSNAIQKDLNSASGLKYKNGQLVGFSYAKPNSKGSDNIKNIEWPSMDPKSPPTTAITTSPFQKMLITSSNSTSQPTVSLGELPPKSNQQLKPSRPPPPAPQKPQIKQSQSSNKNRTTTTANGSVDPVTDSLLAMGFDRIHINAAVRNLGDNTTMLVEHLCALQQLASNKSIRWQHAQEGLFLFQTDIEKAEKYARAYQQLSEIGFDADKIKSALIANDMDTEKALGQLVT